MWRREIIGIGIVWPMDKQQIKVGVGTEWSDTPLPKSQISLGSNFATSGRTAACKASSSNTKSPLFAYCVTARPRSLPFR
jgi:hypothetical protein